MFNDLLNAIKFNYINPNFTAMMDTLSPEDTARMRESINNWMFYEGLHFEQMGENGDRPQITENHCRQFVDKFVATEFNSNFSFKFDETVEEQVLPFVEEVWEDNNKDSLIANLGQMKSVTGDSYVFIQFIAKVEPNGKANPDFKDPFGIYDDKKGYIKLTPIPSTICFPTFKDGFDVEDMESCTVMYPISVGDAIGKKKIVLEKYIYFPNKVEHWQGRDMIEEFPNPYGVIPIVHFKNLPQSGRHFGLSDLRDLIPLNVELNLKNSDVSEILDYHTSPITIVFGARVSQLERGSNKVWGGMPKDGRVENLELQGDLGASTEYRGSIKNAMHEIAGIPKVATGAESMTSNVSGVALSILFMPLTDVVQQKRIQTKKSLILTNQIILKMAMKEGLLVSSLPKAKVFRHSLIWGDILPKDAVVELERLQSEFKMGLETRRGAMKRLKKDNIEKLLVEVDDERDKDPLVAGIAPVILTQGQKLVNPENGEVIADNPAPIVPTAPAGGGAATRNKTSQLSTKLVGVNNRGATLKVNSGITNKNPGK